MNKAAQTFFSYTLLPGIVPRTRRIVSEGFGFIPYSMATVFAACRLLPVNHPYLNPANIGRFGIRHVLAQAAANLRVTSRHLDQVVIFILMLAGAVLLVAQVAAFFFAGLIQAARAQSIPLPTDFTGFFITPDPTNDIAHMVMDRVLGIPDMFGSCVAQNTPCIRPDNVSDGAFPSPLHLAFHELLGFYSYGLMIVGAIILGYYVVTIVSETIHSGTPFGKRFHRVWAPLRLVFAFGLLMPVADGLNTAQYITLHVTKWGSGFGTNGWNFFLDSMATSDTLLGSRDRLIGQANPPEADELIQFMSIATTCEQAYRTMYNLQADAYIVRNGTTPASLTPGDPVVTGNSRAMRLQQFYSQAVAQRYYRLQEWAGFGDVHIVFGVYDSNEPDKYEKFKGGVRPLCGELVLSSKRIVQPASGDYQDGADWLPMRYLRHLVAEPWVDESSFWVGSSRRINRLRLSIHEIDPSTGQPVSVPAPVTLPTIDEFSDVFEWYRTTINDLIDEASDLMVANTDWTNDASEYGWAGAAIWYNKVAEHNGAFTDAVFNMPRVVRYPELMEWVQEEKSKADSQVTGRNRFEPILRDGTALRFTDDKDREILSALNQTYQLWLEDRADSRPVETRNNFIDMVNAVFKVSGLWTFRDNENIHPLAALATLGRSMLINSVASFGAGGVAGILGKAGERGMIKGFMQTASSLLMTIAYIGLAVGIMLYYVVPLLPFIYFFFAIVAWAKTVFEAMVGVPLWALSHLRYDNEGFPTGQSLYGYYLLIDIFLRPILSVFGLVASIIIFYALARTLNGIFDLVVSNLSGFDMDYAKNTAQPETVGSLEYFRGAVDKLFFTIIYAIIVYMMGMASFKLIDQIPDNILRWMGHGARSFGAMTQSDSGREVSSNVLTGSKAVGDQANVLTGGRAHTEENDDGRYS